jgi:hypothetical protein
VAKAGVHPVEAAQAQGAIARSNVNPVLGGHSARERLQPRSRTNPVPSRSPPRAPEKSRPDTQKPVASRPPIRATTVVSRGYAWLNEEGRLVKLGGENRTSSRLYRAQRSVEDHTVLRYPVCCPLSRLQAIDLGVGSKPPLTSLFHSQVQLRSGS